MKQALRRALCMRGLRTTRMIIMEHKHGPVSTESSLGLEWSWEGTSGRWGGAAGSGQRGLSREPSPELHHLLEQTGLFFLRFTGSCLLLPQTSPPHRGHLGFGFLPCQSGPLEGFWCSAGLKERGSCSTGGRSPGAAGSFPARAWDCGPSPF